MSIVDRKCNRHTFNFMKRPRNLALIAYAHTCYSHMASFNARIFFVLYVIYVDSIDMLFKESKKKYLNLHLIKEKGKGKRWRGGKRLTSFFLISKWLTHLYASLGFFFKIVFQTAFQPSKSQHHTVTVQHHTDSVIQKVNFFFF